MPGTDTALDLTMSRVVPLPRAILWRGWTEPAQLVKWFTPAPWRTTACEIDLRPGGHFRTTMSPPDGPAHSNEGCYLEVVPERRLVWTSALTAGYRPAADSPMPMTVILTLDDHPEGTLYQARVLHRDAEGCRQHAAMGFEAGWGLALDQLIGIADQLR
jgi:uncharacterized protein YndB with AHSA1/START domain